MERKKAPVKTGVYKKKTPPGLEEKFYLKAPVKTGAYKKKTPPGLEEKGFI